MCNVITNYDDDRLIHLRHFLKKKSLKSEIPAS